MRTSTPTNSSQKKGSLLLELLIVISLLAVILSIGSEAVFVSLKSSKIAGERDVALGLSNEAIEAVKAVTEENWQNIHSLTKETQHYYATSTASLGSWTLVAGDETIVLNNTTYTRYMTIENVSRDNSSRAILDTGGDNDPSTQKVTVVVSWAGAEPLIASEYFFRWRNKTCGQSSWVGSGLSGNTVQACGTTTYDTIDSTVSTSTGTLKLQ